MAPTKTDPPKKRKRDVSDDKKRKRRKSEESNDEDDAQDRILLLESEILESKKHYNNIVTLIGLASDIDPNPQSATLAAVALCRVFVRLLAGGNLTYRRGLPEKEAVRVEWLKARFSEYKDVLLAFLAREELGSTALTLSMKVLQAEGKFMNEKDFYVFPKAFLDRIVRVLVETDQMDAPSEFLQKYVDEYDDIRYFTHQAIKTIITERAKGVTDGDCFEQVFELLVAIDGVPDSNDELVDFYTPPPKKKTHNLLAVVQHKKQAQEAWLALMKLHLSKAQQKRILGVLTTVIAPWFIQPELLADFLTDCYNTGGDVSLLALSGVFYLIQHRNLDYPSFYTKLYSLLDQDILHSKHRSKFFRLLDTFLGSTHLPAALVASFIKRLSRLALAAPPSAIVFVVPWIYNLLKRHPLCTFMIHREVRTPEQKAQIEKKGFEDPFDPDEEDPMETGAVDSCLWELVQLQSQYHPNVSTIAKIISEQFTKPQYNIEDFLDHSYGSLLESEMTKVVKKEPALQFRFAKDIRTLQGGDPAAADVLALKFGDVSVS